MIAVKEVQNKPLISVTEGKKVGDIKDLYLDTDLTRAAAVFLGREGLFKPRITIVDRSFIQVCGIDAWLTVGSDVAAVLPEGDDAPSLLLTSDLRGREITTEGGTQIGTIGDVLLDNSGQVAGFQLDRIHVKGPLADKKIIPREAVLKPGLKAASRGTSDEPMVIDLFKAETIDLSHAAPIDLPA